MLAADKQMLDAHDIVNKLAAAIADGSLWRRLRVKAKRKKER